MTVLGVTPASPKAVQPPVYPVEIRRCDLAVYRNGNTGVDYVQSFDSGLGGPHVMVNALTHGNELCGMVAVKRLLDVGLRPARGRLTLSFANVAAYASATAEHEGVRFLERDFNRLWHDDLLAADHQSVEALRAHQMRPVLRSVDYLLDLHSTWHAVSPFFVLSQLPRVRALADRLALPARQLFLPDVWHEGYHLIDYGAFRAPDGHAVALIAECGQHFAQTSCDTALQVAVRFLQVCSVVSQATAQALCPDLVGGDVIERYEIAVPVIARTDHFRMLCPYAGFVSFAKGEVAAMDGEQLVLAPFDGAVVVAPRPDPKPGQQAFSWGRLVAA